MEKRYEQANLRKNINIIPLITYILITNLAYFNPQHKTTCQHVIHNPLFI